MKIFSNFLWVLGLLIWSCCFAMGFNYGHGDSLLVSILLLVAVFAIMGISVFLLNKWANPSSGCNKKNAKVKEVACLITYVVMVILTVGGFAHFVAVQTKVKTEVRPLALSRINELKRVFGNDNKEGSYASYVQEMSAKYRNMTGHADERTRDLAVSEFMDEMMGEGTYEILKNQANKFLEDCQINIEYWIPWTVTEYLTQLDTNSEHWNNELIHLSIKNEWAKSTGEKYNPHISTDISLAEMVVNPSISDFNLLAVFLIVILQIMILFSYIRGKDWSQSGPKKYSGKNGGPVVYRGEKIHVEPGNNSNDSSEEI